VAGERWRVRTTRPLRAGQKARIVGREGLLLHIEPQD
jgi:membrane-bound serine protease (ClpP class)